jgi:hypothetical protein
VRCIRFYFSDACLPFPSDQASELPTPDGRIGFSFRFSSEEELTQLCIGNFSSTYLPTENNLKFLR